MLEKEFVPCEESLALKELGFDESCFGWYENNELITLIDCIYPEDRIEFIKLGEISKRTLAPTFSQAFRWFRDKCNLSGVIIPTVTMYWTFKTMTVVESIIEVPPYKHVDANDYRTYEEAELACLRKLIEIVKEKENG